MNNHELNKMYEANLDRAVEEQANRSYKIDWTRYQLPPEQERCIKIIAKLKAPDSEFDFCRAFGFRRSTIKALRRKDLVDCCDVWLTVDGRRWISKWVKE